MKITKYEHACLVVEEAGKKLVIDPGVFSKSLPDLKGVTTLVVTHGHPDHIDPEKVEKIVNSNPEVNLITVQAVADQHGGFNWQVVTGGDNSETDGFKLNFFGGKHATIHPSYPETDNVGLLVNDKLYYPGDSLAEPNDPPTALAVPAAAPWMKISETIDYITKLKPEYVFPTHNAILSEEGHSIYNRQLENACQKAGASFNFLEPGSSVDI